MLFSSSDLVSTARSDCFGCKSRHSAQLDAVARDVPLTYCAQYTFDDFSRILSNATYFDGNATKYDWVVNSGTVLNSTAGELALTLTEENGGTRISSTRYVHYGTITARRECFSDITPCESLKRAWQSRRAGGAEW